MAGPNPHGLAPEQHSSEETSHRWQAIGVTVSDFTSLGIEQQTSAPIASKKLVFFPLYFAVRRV